MRTCIITGAGTGIGRETAIRLSQREDIENLVLMSLGEEELAETKRQMNQEKNIALYDLDLTRYDEVERAIDEVYAKFGRIDILLNFAGYAKAASLMECDLHTWQKTFDINVTSMFWICKQSVRHMQKQGGIILNVSSTSGNTPRPGWLAYASSKSAVIGFSRSLSEELRPYKIRVYSLLPGRCATNMRKGLVPDEDQSVLMQPEDVAHVVNFLVSPEDNCLDGHDIVIRKQAW
ncbi:SDR family oxidoreductase [Brevibacillus sp. B_LB10_24]|uniref:SDR family oxidoreductase n=1 Tax=Brevibacillus sp. B_LB10_24 TaxID=3380645 RepID=UPI0038BCBD62